MINDLFLIYFKDKYLYNLQQHFMKKTNFIVELGQKLNKESINKISSLKNEKELDVITLIDLTFHENKQIAFRAAWILENIYIKHLEIFLPNATYFLNLFSTQNNFSCRRHYAKILALITTNKAPLPIKKLIEDYNTEPLVETVFSWLIDEKNPVAVKSHCLNILANLNSKHNWIKDELIQTMDYLVDKESIAFHAKVKMIRKQLR
jgi:hypothetical protein